MIVIVDANILFSVLITPNGKLATILGHPAISIKWVSCHFLIAELQKHKLKIAKCAKRTEEGILDDLYGYMKNIVLYDEDFIENNNWLEAERLTSGVDLFDMNYVALALQTKGVLWTGDKKLATHLNALGFNQVINTAALAELLNVV